MSKYCPAYPRPARQRWLLWWRLLTRRDNLLAQLSTRSYQMHMGRSQVAGHGVHLVNDPGAVRQVLNDEARQFPKHRFMDDLLRPLLGRSIFTSNGETWARQRKLMEPAFERTRMTHAFEPMRDAVLALLDRLRALPEAAARPTSRPRRPTSRRT